MYAVTIQIQFYLNVAKIEKAYLSVLLTTDMKFAG